MKFALDHCPLAKLTRGTQREKNPMKARRIKVSLRMSQRRATVVAAFFADLLHCVSSKAFTNPLRQDYFLDADPNLDEEG